MARRILKIAIIDRQVNMRVLQQWRKL